MTVKIGHGRMKNEIIFKRGRAHAHAHARLRYGIGTRLGAFDESSSYCKNSKDVRLQEATRNKCLQGLKLSQVAPLRAKVSPATPQLTTSAVPRA